MRTGISSGADCSIWAVHGCTCWSAVGRWCWHLVKFTNTFVIVSKISNKLVPGDAVVYIQGGNLGWRLDISKRFISSSALCWQCILRGNCSVDLFCSGWPPLAESLGWRCCAPIGPWRVMISRQQQIPANYFFRYAEGSAVDGFWTAPQPLKAATWQFKISISFHCFTVPRKTIFLPPKKEVFVFKKNS